MVKMACLEPWQPTSNTLTVGPFPLNAFVKLDISNSGAGSRNGKTLSSSKISPQSIHFVKGTTSCTIQTDFVPGLWDECNEFDSRFMWPVRVCATSIEDKSGANGEIFHVQLLTERSTEGDPPPSPAVDQRDDFDLRLMWTLAGVWATRVHTAMI